MDISRIIIFCDDLKRLESFYVEVLGLNPVGEASADWACFEAGAVHLCLHSLPVEYRGDGSDGYPKREDSYTKFCFRSADVDADRARLVEMGVRMGEVFRFGELSFCDGADPEGNIFQISSR